MSKLLDILATLDQAVDPMAWICRDFGFMRYEGILVVAVSANWCVTFCFEDGFAVVDYVDYH